MIDFKTFLAVSDPRVKKILHTIVERKSVEFRQLTVNVDPDFALQALETSKKAELIKETPSPIKALKTYYVTALGLKADRLIID